MVPSRYEGRFAIVTSAGWDAVAVDALLTNGAWCGRRSRVVLTPRCWRQAFAEVSVKVTVTTAWTPGRSRY